MGCGSHTVGGHPPWSPKVRSRAYSTPRHGAVEAASNRRRLHGLIDRALEPFDAPDRVIDCVQIVQPRRLLRRVLELHLSDPRQVSLGPRRHRRRRPPAVAQQTFPRWRARNWSFFAASRARTKSRSASWAASGTHTAVRSGSVATHNGRSGGNPRVC